jgi:DNA-binding MarR family transcriptional regulator
VPEIFPADPRLLEEVAELLHRVNRRLRRRAVEQLGRVGLTPAQARALRVVDRAERPLRMSALAEQLHIAPRSATSVVDELVERDLVARQPDPRDRRATAVVLTPRGRETRRRIASLRHEALAELANALATDDLRQLRHLLARLDEQAANR